MFPTFSSNIWIWNRCWHAAVVSCTHAVIHCIHTSPLARLYFDSIQRTESASTSHQTNKHRSYFGSSDEKLCCFRTWITIWNMAIWHYHLICIFANVYVIVMNHVGQRNNIVLKTKCVNKNSLNMCRTTQEHVNFSFLFFNVPFQTILLYLSLETSSSDPKEPLWTSYWR